MMTSLDPITATTSAEPARRHRLEGLGRDFKLLMTLTVNGHTVKDIGSTGKGDVGLLYSGGIWRPDRIVRNGTYHFMVKDDLISFSVQSELFPLYNRTGFLLKMTLKNRTGKSMEFKFIPDVNPGKPSVNPLNKWTFGQPPRGDDAKSAGDNRWSNESVDISLLEESPDMEIAPDESKVSYLGIVFAEKDKTFYLAVIDWAERRDRVLIEDDYEIEMGAEGRAQPALKSLDRTGRVVYVGSLSKTLAAGIRMGYIVAHRDLIREARAMRRLMLRHPPANNQRSAALFLAMGYHDALLRRLRQACAERGALIVAALERHLPDVAVSTAPGASSGWLRFPDRADTRALAVAAERAGVLIEPGDVFFAGDRPPRQYARLGFASIATDRIAAGIGPALERVYDGLYEKVEGERCRDRIPGDPDDRLALHDAEDDRLARA